MVTSCIKDANRCSYAYTPAHRLVCIIYTPHMYYAHLRNVLFQLTTSPLVVIITDEQSFRLR